MSENLSDLQLSPRLKMIYDMLPESCIIWDVGTDHAFLPIYCIKTGKCRHAFASDIREKPLEIAKKNIAAYNCLDTVETYLAAGMSKCAELLLETSESTPDTVVIAGMGGFTICSILSEEMAHIREYFPGNITFILQPNTAEHELRMLLWKNGFEICDECAVRDGRHVYAAFKCVYRGAASDFTEIECYIGNIMPDRLSENDFIYLDSVRAKYSNITKGLMSRHIHDSESLERLLRAKRIVSELDRILGGM